MNPVEKLLYHELAFLGERKCRERFKEKAAFNVNDEGHDDDDAFQEGIEIWSDVSSAACKKDHQKLEEFLRDIVGHYLTNSCDQEQRELGQLKVLRQGVALLQLFVEVNWTGPFKNYTQQQFKTLLERPCSKFFGEDSEYMTEVQNIAVADLFHASLRYKIEHPELLWMAKLVLLSCGHLLDNCLTSKWWALRCIYVHQQVLEEQSSVLYETATNLIDKAVLVEPLMTSDEYKHLQVQFHLEMSNIFACYRQISKSKAHFQTAQRLCGITTSFTGALGKRTRHQAEDKSQLVLKVERSHRDFVGDVPVLAYSEIPEDVKLNCEDLLNAVSFKDDAESYVVDLQPEELAVVLNSFLQLKRASPSDEMTREELTAFLTTVLRHPKNWAIQVMALFCRSVIESKSRRTVERSMMQLQTLVSSIENSHPSFARRNQLFYAVSLPTLCNIKIELANVLVSLGVTRDALKIYLDLEKWESVIQCYQLLGQKTRAEKVIRERLSVKETPTLWCRLAEATDDPQYYENAWELSEHRSATAQKGLGDYHYKRKKYSECIPHYQKSLEISNLQLDAWSALAFAAMQVEDWELTAKAYREVLSLEPDNFLAWNNLSKAYLKMKQKSRAWKTLQEALKCNYDEWRIWENYLVVSTDCGAFEEIINAYHRILDLKGKHLDVEILSILVQAIAEDIPDCEGNSSRKLHARSLELFGRLTSQVTNNSKLWLLYSDLTAVGDGSSAKEKGCQLMQKALRCALSETGWERDGHQRQEVVDLSLRLVEAQMELSSDLTGEERRNLLSRAKLALEGVAGRLRVYQNSLLQASDEVAEKITIVETKLALCVEMINKAT